MGIQTKAAIEIKHREGSKYRKFCDKEDLSVFQPPVSSPVLCPAMHCRVQPLLRTVPIQLQPTGQLLISWEPRQLT